MSVFFGGRLITTPTTASVVNDDAMRNKNLTVGNVAAFVGRSAGGKPKTALRFGSPSEAKAELVSGELLEAVLAAFDPSAETGSPTTVVAVPVQPSTQATGVIKDASNATVINLTSVGYGSRENLVSFKVEAGTLSGLRVTTKRGDSYYSKDNIERRGFSVVYAGGAASATVTVDATQVVLAAPAGTVVATLPLSSFPTIADLAERISLVPGFTAAVLDGNGGFPTEGALDFVSAQSVKPTAYNVTGTLQAVVDWLNSAAQGYVSAVRAAGAGTLPAVTPLTFLAGAADGTVTFNDWSLAFEALQREDVQWLTPISADPAIHALADTHCAYMSTVGRKERRAVCGMATGTTDAQAVAAAHALNSDRTSLVHLGHYAYNTAGKLVLFPAYITAALIAGAFSGVNPGTALTNKTLKLRGLERNLRNPTDTDVLINGGVLCVEDTEQGYKVVKSISTWRTNDNYNRVEQSTGWAADFVARNVRQAVDVLRGAKANPLLLSRAVSITESVLRELARGEPQGPGVLAGDEANPAYKNITASIEGDVLRIEFECSPVIPCNYVLATIYAVPYSGTATA